MCMLQELGGSSFLLPLPDSSLSISVPTFFNKKMTFV